MTLKKAEIQAIEEQEEQRLHQEAAKSQNPTAALLLLKVMSDISEDHYSAGWIAGNGFNLWNILTTFEPDNPCNYGMSLMTQKEVDWLRWLSQQCNGWWYWNEEEQEDGTERGETFVNLQEWKPIYQAAFNWLNQPFQGQSNKI